MVSRYHHCARLTEEKAESQKPVKRQRIVLKKSRKTSESSDPVPKPRKRRWGSIKTSKSENVSISSDTLKDIIDINTVRDALDKPMEENEDLPEAVGEEPDKENDSIVIENEKKMEEDGEIVEEEVEVEEEVMDAETVEPPSEPLPLKHDGRKVISIKHVDNKQTSEEPVPPAKEATKRKIRPTKSVEKVTRKHSSESPPAKKSAPEEVLNNGHVERDVSPAKYPVSKIIHVQNLVRPFTLKLLKELLSKTGTLDDESFWIDKIKSHCFATYATEEEAVKTRNRLHRIKWPSSNPKELVVEFSTERLLMSYKGTVPEDNVAAPQEAKRQDDRRQQDREKRREREERNGKEKSEKEHDRDRDRVSSRHRREEVPERRRERSPKLREWDRDKLNQEQEPRPPRHRERDSSRDRERREKRRVKEKEPEEPPAKLLDDLFRKTKAIPSIYWLPLTDEQSEQRDKKREEERVQRKLKREEEQKEREAARREREAARSPPRRRENPTSRSPQRSDAIRRRRESPGNRQQSSGRSRERNRKQMLEQENSSSSGDSSSSSSSSDDNSDSDSDSDSDSSSQESSSSPVKKNKK